MGRNLLSQEDIYCHTDTIAVTGRNLAAQEEICHHRKKFAVTGNNFLSQENNHVSVIKFKKSCITERKFKRIRFVSEVKIPVI